MPFSTFAKDLMLDVVAGGTHAGHDLYASLHSADPGDTGASEIAGGSPAYARIGPVTFDPSSGGVVMKDTGFPVVFDVQSGDAVSFGGLWSDPTAGDWFGGGGVTPVAFSGQGIYELTAINMSIEDPA